MSVLVRGVDGGASVPFKQVLLAEAQIALVGAWRRWLVVPLEAAATRRIVNAVWLA